MLPTRAHMLVLHDAGEPMGWPTLTPMPRKYRKRPVVIEAVELTSTNGEAVAAWCGDSARYHRHDGRHSDSERLVIETLEGPMRANIGDYVIKGVAGEFYPCRADIFLDTYEPMGMR